MAPVFEEGRLIQSGHAFEKEARDCGAESGDQLTVISYQLSVFSGRGSVFSCKWSVK